ncbi:MAG TPA: YggT family protein [Nitrospirota bacterium]
MFVLGNVILGFAEVLDWILVVSMWIIAIRALISWVNPDPYNPIVQILQKLTEPILRPLRKLAPPYKIGIDISPIIAFLLIIFLRIAVVNTLIRIGRSMG